MHTRRFTLLEIIRPSPPRDASQGAARRPYLLETKYKGQSSTRLSSSPHLAPKTPAKRLSFFGPPNTMRFAIVATLFAVIGLSSATMLGDRQLQACPPGSTYIFLVHIALAFGSPSHPPPLDSARLFVSTRHRNEPSHLPCHIKKNLLLHGRLQSRLRGLHHGRQGLRRQYLWRRR